MGRVIVTNEHCEEISACMTPLKDSRRSQRVVGRLKGTTCVTRKALKQQSRNSLFSHGIADAAEPFADITWSYSTLSPRLYHSNRKICT